MSFCIIYLTNLLSFQTKIGTCVHVVAHIDIYQLKYIPTCCTLFILRMFVITLWPLCVPLCINIAAVFLLHSNLLKSLYTPLQLWYYSIVLTMKIPYSKFKSWMNYILQIQRINHVKVICTYCHLLAVMEQNVYLLMIHLHLIFQILMRFL